MEMSKKQKLVKQKKQPNGTVQSVKLMFIFMHPYIVSDGCLEWNHLKCVGLKAPQKSTYWLCRQCYYKGK
jgi:hypothetical protein